MLEVKKLTKHFGGLTAVANVDMTLGDNQLVGLIGPNGAGKTTLFNLLTGVYAPSSGSIELTVNGSQQKIAGLPTYKIANLGLSRTFQNIRLFRDLTVLDNVRIAINGKQPQSVVKGILRLPSFFHDEQKIKQKAQDLLALFDLESKQEQLAKNLSYGEQRCLEIVRALATEPKILFLDEPAAGMNPQETAQLTAIIRQIQQDFGITVLLIEHDMSLVMSICQRIYVLEYGRLIAHGTPDQIKQNPDVIKAYLGGELIC